MRHITKSFYAVQSGDHWTVFGRSDRGYLFTIVGVCDGFYTFRDARRFALQWINTSARAGVCPSSRLGRDVARSIKTSYDEWVEECGSGPLNRKIA